MLCLKLLNVMSLNYSPVIFTMFSCSFIYSAFPISWFIAFVNDFAFSCADLIALILTSCLYFSILLLFNLSIEIFEIPIFCNSVKTFPTVFESDNFN